MTFVAIGALRVKNDKDKSDLLVTVSILIDNA